MRNLVLGLGKECDGGSDGGDAAFLDDDGGEVAVVEGLDVHVGLVGLDDDDAVALGELVAFGFGPGDDFALGHGGAQCRHENLPDLGPNDEARGRFAVGNGGGAAERGGGGRDEGSVEKLSHH